MNVEPAKHSCSDSDDKDEFAAFENYRAVDRANRALYEQTKQTRTPAATTSSSTLEPSPFELAQQKMQERIVSVFFFANLLCCLKNREEN